MVAEETPVISRVEAEVAVADLDIDQLLEEVELEGREITVDLLDRVSKDLVVVAVLEQQDKTEQLLLFTLEALVGTDYQVP